MPRKQMSSVQSSDPTRLTLTKGHFVRHQLWKGGYNLGLLVTWELVSNWIRSRLGWNLWLSNYLKENLVCSENWSWLSFKWQSDQVIKRLSSCLLTLFISSTFQPNIGQKELPLPGNGQPKSAGDDFVQDLAPPGQGVPSGTYIRPAWGAFCLTCPICAGLHIFPGSLSWSILEEQRPAPKTGYIKNALGTGVGNRICVDSSFKSRDGLHGTGLTSF